MTTEREKKTTTTPTGRHYNSVEELLRGESVSQEVVTKFSELEQETSIAQSLVQMRQAANLTQQQLADKLGKSQGAISKLESSDDDQITILELTEYSLATGQAFNIGFGPTMNRMEQVRWHALEIKKHLSALAKDAQQSEEAEMAVKAFFGEAFFNLLTILTKCHMELPNTGVKARFKRVGSPSFVTVPRSNIPSELSRKTHEPVPA
ncbi:MAG: helix-turn-helix domain-containing protein [Verrucomicrobia bacterium]|nr:helix-turn-helix domain-containing protein [Verrucomicrobiota bacterium]